MTQPPNNELQPDATTAALGKIALEATEALTAAVAQGVADKTSAAMNDVYSVALQSLSHIKIQIENLEHALELKRKQSLDEVNAFVLAAAEALNFASSIGRALNRLEQTALATPTLPPRT